MSTNIHEWSLVVAVVSCQALSDSFVMRWTIASQASLFLGFPRQEYRGGLPFPSPEDLPNTGTEPQSPTFQVVSGIAGGLWHCWRSLALQAVCTAGGLWHCRWSLTLQAESLPTKPPGEPRWSLTWLKLGPNSFFGKHCSSGNLVLS